MDELNEKQIVINELHKLIGDLCNLDKIVDYKKINNKLKSLKDEFNSDEKINSILSTLQIDINESMICKTKYDNFKVICKNIFEKIKDMIINDKIIIEIDKNNIINILSKLLLEDFIKCLGYTYFELNENDNLFDLNIEIKVIENTINSTNIIIEDLQKIQKLYINYKEQLDIFILPLINKQINYNYYLKNRLTNFL
jgi:hypothetical protein